MVTDEKFYKNLLDNLFEGVYFVDKQRSITFWNKAAEQITGYESKEIVGSHCFHNLLRHVDDEGAELCRNACPLSRTILDGKPRESRLYLHHKGGHRIPVTIRISPILGEDGSITGAVEIFNTDIGECPEPGDIEQLQRLAMIDPLTNLGNRRYGETQLASKISELDRHELTFGLLFIDIDKFKRINDTFGHEIGDEALKMFARTMLNNLRPLDVLCRWGGEEFIVILPHMEEKEKLIAAAERMRVLIASSSIASGEDIINLTVSVGATLSRTGDTEESVVARADALMYEAKQVGGNKVVSDLEMTEEQTSGM